MQTCLQDLTDDQWLVSPHEAANHIAWQPGHLIAAEHSLNNIVCPGAMPLLPEGFAEQHTPKKIQQFGAIIGGQSARWIMHAGHWVIVRRQLGKDAIY